MQTANPRKRRRLRSYVRSLSLGCDVTGVPVAPGRVNGEKCTVLRDSGCSTVTVKRGLVATTEPQTGIQIVSFADRSTKRVPTTIVFLDCPYYTGSVEAALLDEPLYDVILININGVKCPGIQVHDQTNSQDAAAVETRAASQREVKKLKTPKESDLGLSRDKLKALKQEDPTLEQARKNAETDDVIHTGRDNHCWYSYQKGVLVRHFKSPRLNMGMSLSRWLCQPVCGVKSCS
ncbi:hypothetical protein PoB_000911900 [Plakobranchus ocellatus]|uniref:Uncharacterized protein n=1 Tax=Plakobranchus ocellatus TaxID=259542 RepID=A0AAV3YKP3_9GAST|nr:hypothetical protein PoB_000911900 [Plakobranchus ocellatus]